MRAQKVIKAYNRFYNWFFVGTVVFCSCYVGLPVCNSRYLLISLDIMYLELFSFEKMKTSAYFDFFGFSKVSCAGKCETRLGDSLLIVRLDLFLHHLWASGTQFLFRTTSSSLDCFLGRHTLSERSILLQEKRY